VSDRSSGQQPAHTEPYQRSMRDQRVAGALDGLLTATVLGNARSAVLAAMGNRKKLRSLAPSGPNRFLTTAADPIGDESAYLPSQGRSLNNRRPVGRHRGPRLCGAEAGRLRLLYQQQWTSGAESMR
jgi:hypothetical protein